MGWCWQTCCVRGHEEGGGRQRTAGVLQERQRDANAAVRGGVVPKLGRVAPFKPVGEGMSGWLQSLIRRQALVLACLPGEWGCPLHGVTACMQAECPPLDLPSCSCN